MESFFLQLGLSHTLSKVVPYLLVLLFGLFIGRLVYKRFKSNKRTAVVLALFFVIVPFIAYFAISPIYQGDFGLNGKKHDFRNIKSTLFDDGLLVIALPGCPYCMESIALLKTIKERRPNLKIEFTVLGFGDNTVLEGYKNEVAGKFKVTRLLNESAFTSKTGSSYPTYVMIKKGKVVHSWTNNEFGVVVRDRVENWE
jgi:thiol-disulfide isomerase/thioredoxin